MNIEGRIERAERQLGLEGAAEPFIVALSAESHKGDAQYEGRLRQRIEKAKREHAGEPFWLLC
jgi:hypothetical protein